MAWISALILLGLFSPGSAERVSKGASGVVVTWSGTLQYDEDWGYVTVRGTGHTFWWLYAVKPANNRPLFLWLQGGPGSDSTGFGNIDEIGPKDVNEKDRASTWLQVADLVFVDNPVGAGFSYVDSSSTYTTNVQQIGQDLLTWAQTFFTLHSEYRNRPFYIFCESYGGKMSAEFAKVIIDAVKAGSLSVNLRGVALGDSWISAMDYVNTWGPYLKANSYLDETQLGLVNSQADRCQKLVDGKQWTDATYCWSDMEDLIATLTGGVSWYNILKNEGQDDWSKSTLSNIQKSFLRHVKQPGRLDAVSDYMDTVARKKFGIIPSNVRFGAQSGQVFSRQYGDFMTPNWDTVDYLLANGTNVIVYNGNLDLICDTLGTEAWIDRLQWSELSTFQKAAKTPFSTKSYPLAGYVKKHKNLQLWYILRAGHMVAHDTEESAVYLLQQVVKNTRDE